MKIQSHSRLLPGKSGELRRQFHQAVAAKEARGQLAEAIDLVRSGRRLEDVSGKTLKSMRRRAELKAGVEKLIPDWIDKAMLGGVAASTLAGGFLANRAGAGWLLTIGGGIGGLVAAGVTAGVSTWFVQDKLVESGQSDLRLLDDLESKLRFVPSFKGESTELELPESESIQSMLETAQQGKTGFHIRQKKLLAEDSEWFKAENKSELTGAQFRRKMKFDNAVGGLLEGATWLRWPVNLAATGAAGYAANAAGAGWFLTGLAGVGGLVASAITTAALARKAEDLADDLRHEGWETRLERLQFAARPAEAEVPEFSLPGYLKMLEAEIRHAPADQARVYTRLHAELERQSPTLGLAQACSNLYLNSDEKKMLGKDWFKRSLASLREQEPDRPIDIQLDENLIVVGDHDLYLQ